MKLTVEQALAMAVDLKESPTPRLDVEVLLSSVLGRPRSFLYGWPEYQLEKTESEVFLRLLARRKQGHPLAFLTGEREFWSLPLAVSNQVLIPRPETELVVETALECWPFPQRARVCDLGTGSGAIALALASERPHWLVTAVEYSEGALAVAAANRHRLALHQVQLLLGNWGSALADNCMDLLVSNPPYIHPEDPHLSRGDLRFEPRSALAAAEGGLACFRIIARQAQSILAPGGWLILEHGYDQAADVAGMLSANGFDQISSRTDLAGQPRVSVGRKSPV